MSDIIANMNNTGYTGDIIANIHNTGYMGDILWNGGQQIGIYICHL